MSRFYDSIEPNVINEEILQKAVEEQGPQDDAGQLAKKEGINFKEVKALQLDFRSKGRSTKESILFYKKQPACFSL